MTENNLLAALLAHAANIGANVKAEMAEAKESLDKSRQRREHVNAEIDANEARASGFDAPRFIGLASVAGEFARIYNGQDSDDTRDAAQAAASTFTGAFTAQTEKSAKGGKSAGYTHAILLGTRAETLRNALAARLRHWRDVLDSAPEDESPSAKAARVAEAKRFLVPCGEALMEDGSVPLDDKGNEKRAKFMGRPARTVRGVPIKFGRATNRDSQMAEASRFFATYGDVVLTSEVLDALLDNGGRYKPEGDESLSGMCAEARGTLDKIMAAGGANSGDAAFLMALHATLGRIMTEGFKTSQVAGTQDAPENADQGDPLAGTGGESLDAQEGAGAPSDAPGVVLGEGIAPAAGKTARPRRNKGKEVQAGA
jgi:hypothetical protein